MNIPIQDLSFIPAYISAFLSTQYAIAKNPKIVNSVLTFITSLFGNYNENGSTTTKVELWRIPDVAMIPIGLVFVVSFSTISRHVELNQTYSTFMLIAVTGAIVLGWIFGLLESVLFGLLPMMLVTALLVARVAEKFEGSGDIQEEEDEEEQTPFIEKP